MPRSDVTAPRFRLLRYRAEGAGVNDARHLAYLLVISSGLLPHLMMTMLRPVTLWAAFRLHAASRSPRPIEAALAA